MNLSDETIQTFLTMPFRELYQNYITLQHEHPTLKKNYHKIRFGIKTAFDIHDHFDNYITIKPRKNLVSINGKICHLTEYRDEIEARESLCRHTILTTLTSTPKHYKPMQQT